MRKLRLMKRRSKMDKENEEKMTRLYMLQRMDKNWPKYVRKTKNLAEKRL